ncbi:hypothetical protein [Fructobacillus tropaeoli]|uniref:Uncharacterized protein n=1 Tax=Fructobacillus tropaeoli TaxID=709323 RepID=A0ABN9YMD3_9LACO|nr:hypothetical protein [Fructobacillus tropaeoli]GIC70619.1 hypothetical protein FT12353_12950 [Fructobacillus tropaeoli]CAK1228312.1 hypothetical protein R53137_KAKDMLNK_00226 [Fructobacillus tropaeoli]CAK1235156.1 hypothetical protein LMG30238_FMBOGHMB_00639 [Fructobacillus tropaeoli]
MSEFNEQAATQPNETQEVTETPVNDQPQAKSTTATDEVQSAFGQTKTFEYKDNDGNVLREYHFQFPGIEAGLKITDLVASNLTEYRQQMVKQLVTDPEVRSKGLEWFDTHKGMFEVLQALDTFLGEMLDGVRV